ncbi:MFS transporter [Gordonia polyisoprenivorans]|uniref:MFS transporter n=1 Tax=Gordonia polyisoprenivorans TaxID=84595 RepID=UPI001AD64029|nr:MFS transporter [Gordonia polyisoprenivorans]QTI69949.1 MFS transporter [Gordonia polyisoprenivorans]
MPRASRRRSHYRLTYVVLIAAAIGFSLLQSLTSPVLGLISEHLGTDRNTVTWVLTAYLISAAVCTPIIGRMGDRVGKERMLVVSMCALALGCLAGVFAPTIGWLIAARILQGVGGGAVPLCFGIIRDEFPEQNIAGAVGFTASVVAVGGGVGVVVAGPILDVFAYTGLFWVPFVVTSAAAIAAYLLVPDSPVRTPAPISVLPAVLLSSWLVAFLVPLSQGSRWGWASPLVIGLILLSALLCWAWVYVELHSKAPLIDMAMMSKRAVWTCNVVALVLGWTLFSAFAFLPQFAQVDSSNGYGFSASVTTSGLLVLPAAVAMVLMGLFSPWLARKVGARTVVFVGCLTMSGAMAVLTFAHGTLAHFYIANGILGIGQGMVISCMAGLVVAAVPPDQTGVASGMNANIRNVGGSIGAAVSSMIITAHVSTDGVPAESGFTWAFGTMSATMALVSIAALAIPSTSQKRLVDELAVTPTPTVDDALTP